MKVQSGRVVEIAPEDPRQAITSRNPDVFNPRTHRLAIDEQPTWSFPPRSVSVVELDCVRSA